MTPVMPSVITSGGMRRKMMPRPLTTPTSRPAPSTAASASGMLLSWPAPIMKVRMAPSVTTAPAERSIPSPPLMITSVCPAAMMPRKAARRKMFSAWAAMRKSGWMTPPMRKSTTERSRAMTVGETMTRRTRLIAVISLPPDQVDQPRAGEGGEDDERVDERLVPAGDAREGDDVADDREDSHADHRAYRAAAAAGQTGAAQDDGHDRGERHVVTDAGVAGAYRHGQGDGGEGAEDPGGDVGAEAHQTHPQARGARRLVVAAHCVEVVSKAGAQQEQPQDYEQRDAVGGDGHLEDVVAVEAGEVARHGTAGPRQDRQGEAGEDERRGVGGDDRLQPQHRHAQAVHRAGERPDAHPDEHGAGEFETARIGRDQRHEHRIHQRHHRAHR